MPKSNIKVEKKKVQRKKVQKKKVQKKKVEKETEEKLYPCQHCVKKFTRTSNLKAGPRVYFLMSGAPL